MIQTIQMLGFAPDVDTNILPGQGSVPGPWTSCDGFYPTLRGFRRQRSPVPAYPALPTRVTPLDDGSAYGAASVGFLDGTSRVFVGTRTALYLASAGVYTHYSTTEDFDTQPEDRWRFAPFGDDLIATNGKDSPQFITSTGTDFVALAGIPPVGKVVASVNGGGNAGFVFLLNLLSEVPGNLLTPTMWWCSAIGNDASWTPDIATQCANGYLNETQGPIVGAAALNRYLIVYKQKATYRFEYVGGSDVWVTPLVQAKAGAVSHEAIIDHGDVHAVMGLDGFYLVDGSGTPQPIECPLRRFLFEDAQNIDVEGGDLNPNFAWATQGYLNRATGVSTWHYASIALDAAGTTPQVLDSWVAWHRETNRWTMGRLDVEQLVRPEIQPSPGLTYGEIGSVFPTWGTPDDVTYDSFLFSGSSGTVPAIIKPDHILYSLTGLPEAGAFFRLGTWGDGQTYKWVRRMRPKFAIYPQGDGLELAVYERANLGEAESEYSTAVLDLPSGFIDVLANVKLADFSFEFPDNDAEIVSVDVDFDEAGH